MKLYILKPKNNLGKEDPWEPWYDKTFGAVVRAKDKSEARQILAREDMTAWLSEECSTCEELTTKSKSEIIIKDVHWA